MVYNSEADLDQVFNQEREAIEKSLAIKIFNSSYSKKVYKFYFQALAKSKIDPSKIISSKFLLQIDYGKDFKFELQDIGEAIYHVDPVLLNFTQGKKDFRKASESIESILLDASQETHGSLLRIYDERLVTLISHIKVEDIFRFISKFLTVKSIESFK